MARADERSEERELGDEMTGTTDKGAKHTHHADDNKSCHTRRCQTACCSGTVNTELIVDLSNRDGSKGAGSEEGPLNRGVSD